MKIEIYNKQKSLPISSRSMKKIVSAVLALEQQVCDEVSVHFVTEHKIRNLHKKYFNEPTTTDCISFPMDNLDSGIEYRILGEVFVCPQTAIYYAQTHACHPYKECILYVVHGLLHLMGFDDRSPKEKATMRRAEKKHMLNLQKLNLLKNM